MERVEYDLVVDRHAHLLKDFQIVGIDLTGSVFSMQIRVQPEAPGAPLFTLVQNDLMTPGIGLRVAGTNTVQGHINDGNLDAVPPGMALDEVIPLSVLSVWWAGANTAPFGKERRLDSVLYYDIKLSRTNPPILPKVIFGGKLVVRSGVTV